MPVRPRGQVFEVAVNRKAALPGYTRIRKTAKTRADALRLEAEIDEALTTYGKWPVAPNDKPLQVQAQKGHHQDTVERAIETTERRSGTLREAMKVALDSHWFGKRYYDSVKYVIAVVVDFLEKRGRADLDEITSDDIDALVANCREQDLAPSTINKHLGALRVVNEVALKRIPPLATVKLPIPHITGKRIEKWWLKPEDHKRVVAALRDPLEGSLPTDLLFADLIDIIVYQGLRVEEALRMEARMFTGLDGDRPWFNPNGTKTVDAGNAIPVYPEALEPIQRAIKRQAQNRWSRMFPLTPRQAGYKWNEVRDFLGVSDIPTATMKALRRTFAWYANSRGMPTSTLQKVLRHKDIATTAGYLHLVGDGALEQSRDYFSQDSTSKPKVGTDIGSAITAYAQIPGVTPEDVARFTKELMT